MSRDDSVNLLIVSLLNAICAAMTLSLLCACGSAASTDDAARDARADGSNTAMMDAVDAAQVAPDVLVSDEDVLRDVAAQDHPDGPTACGCFDGHHANA